MQTVVSRLWQTPSVAMFRSGALRNLNNARTISNCLIRTHCLSKSDFTVSAVVLRERRSDQDRYSKYSRPSPLHVDPLDKSQQRKKFAFPEQTPRLEITAGGGPRPRAPRQWKTKTRRGSIAKSVKLIDIVHNLSNVKEEIYNTLDAWIAWDLEFPLIAVKKAIKDLSANGEWRRVIQLTKWMLDKGQGKTLATYLTLLEALDHEGRVDEAEVLWEKVFQENMECIPRTMFSRMISMYQRYGKPKQLLKVFADMEELGVKPDFGTVKRVSKIYADFGYPEYAQSLWKKYPFDSEGKFVRKERPSRGPGREEIIKTPSRQGTKKSDGIKVGDNVA
ncbi:protein MpPPR_37 [Marchantia polymorpha subsp. ruderalis]|uniref:Pentacotripeptide-repeat region of PRORP domain-containing protein n=2 Tax=Marchantia polymorpha TaxID=3197 RepID=A0AAF6BPJ3_MARPO|nr:hypothetical protein MARPO_0053s0063 [Marchantia polymorpha]BBN13927.1 hypothetical protein Mp_6g07490 [Marchantia polymorpha subsp. ruderalis]|eukprot:PTQ38129.1 hypothetical protein MARPO_0053s0063 [Marchantia polymorpha]